MTGYELYKPFRNYLRQFPVIESLRVVRAYMHNLQYDTPLPAAIETGLSFKYANSRIQKNVYEWELELIAKEIVLNCPNYGKKSLCSWDNFSRAIQMLRDLENEIYGKFTRHAQQNIWDEMFRLAHRQFPWQRKLSENTLLRYFKIFGDPEFELTLKERFGVAAPELYCIGLGCMGHFLDDFALRRDIKIEVPGITREGLNAFIDRFAVDLSTLRKQIIDAQSYDQDFAYAWNPLRKFPLIAMRVNGNDQVLAPILPLVIRRFTEGVYYELCDATGFSDAFGNSFQRYVGDVLETANTKGSYTVLPEHEYRVGKERKASVDWITLDATGDLFLECKTKRLRLDAKIGAGATQAMHDDLEKMADFIVQMYKTLVDALNGVYPHWSPRKLPIYPLIVVLEEWFAFGTDLLARIDASVEKKMQEKSLALSVKEQHPFTICAVEDLELCMRVIADVGIGSLMGQKVSNAYKTWPMFPFLTEKFSSEMKQLEDSLFKDDMKKIHPAFS